MSGQGARFARAGYSSLKPLIEVDGMPIIEHVVNMFPGETDFLFVCNAEHLETTPLAKILHCIKPTAEIVPIPPHKYGPVYAVLQAADHIRDSGPAIVNYCDFSVYWDYGHFKQTIEETACDGCLPAYTGFHPHLLNEGVYAGILVDDQNYMIEIREKHCFTQNKMDCFHSAGTYYFKTGMYIKEYFKKLMDKNINVNNEYYVSSVFQLMREDGLDIYVYELEHFLQWGTPQDLEEYVYWSEYFRARKRAEG